MKRLIFPLAALALAAVSPAAEPARLLDKANVLPLALDDAFQFRKTKTMFFDPKLNKPSTDDMISFERSRINFGAVTQNDRRERWGHYYTFFWRTARPADLTVRFEYRQENLGSHVQARELHYPAAKGSLKSEFQIIGDDYEQEGKVTAWRALLIENGKIVALNQSYLWN
jgi:hypothetical protein